MPLVSGAKTSTNAAGLQDTIYGISYSPVGVIYRAYDSTVSYASSDAATSIMPTYTTKGYGSRKLIGLRNNAGIIGGFYPGMLLKTFIYGLITNTGTPNLTTTIGLVDDGSNFEALGTTGAVAMTTISGNGVLQVTGWIDILALSGSNNVLSWVEHRYNNTFVTSVPTLFTVDLTQADLTVDVRTTFSASSASNAISAYGGFIEAR